MSREEYVNKNKDELVDEVLELRGRIRDLQGLRTNRSDIEEILRRTERNLRNIISSNVDAMIIVDENNKIRFVNDSAEIIFDRSRTEIIGETFDFPVEVSQKHEVEIFRERKRSVIVEIRVSEVEWEGKVVKLASLRDITERKELDRLKDEFISTVSHELRTPLTPIREAISLIYDGVLGETTEKQRSVLDVGLKNIDRLTRIINDLLDISKIEAGKIYISTSSVDMVKIVEGVVDTFSSQAKTAGLDLNMKFSEDSMVCFVDKDKIIQVFSNLIGNALKFTEKGTVEVSIIDKGAFAECCVSDTGRGISTKDLPKVFNKFQQFGKITEAEHKGTGLGLAISRGIVELHGGEIWVESDLDKGTKFIFTLPKKKT